MSRVFKVDYIPDPSKGRPLWNAKIYVGIPNEDPTIPSNQIQLTGDIGFPVGQSIPVPQPVRTNKGGVTVYNNSPLDLNAPGQEYAIAIYDRNDNLIYNFPQVDGVVAMNTTSQEEITGLIVHPDIGIATPGQTVDAGVTAFRAVLNGSSRLFTTDRPVVTSGILNSIVINQEYGTGTADVDGDIYQLRDYTTQTQEEITGIDFVNVTQDQIDAGFDLFPLIGQGIRVAGVGLWVVPGVTADGSPMPNPALLDSIPTNSSTSVTINGASDTVILSQVEIYAGSVDTFSSRSFPIGAVVKASFYRAGGEPVKGLKYKVESPSVADGVINHNDASGNLLKLIPTNGRITTSQCGLESNDSLDVSSELSTIFNSQTPYRIIVDGRHFFGNTGLLVSEKFEAEFIGEGAFLCNEEDGGNVTNYLTIEGNASGFKLFYPKILNLTTPSVRVARPAINPRNIDDWEIHAPFVDGTCGGGVLCSNSKRGRVFGGSTQNTLADGWHIAGGSFDVQYIGVNALNNGDDNFAMVSTIADGPNQSCFISGVGRDSQARGASMVGCRSCKMDVIIRNAALDGGIIAQDDVFNTEDNQDCILEIQSVECGGNGVRVGRATKNCTIRGRAKRCNRGLNIGDATVQPENITIDFESAESTSFGMNVGNCNGLFGNFSSRLADENGVALTSGLSRYDLRVTVRDAITSGAGANVLINGTGTGKIDISSFETRGAAFAQNHLQILNSTGVDISSLKVNGPTIGAPVGYGVGNTDITFPSKRVNGVAAEFNDISNTINTEDIYRPGKEAWDETTSQSLRKNGTTSGSVWIDSTGATVYTPA